MRTFILIFLFFSSLTLFSQEYHLSNKSVSTEYKLNSIDSVNHSALSIGAGPIFYNRSVKTDYLFSLDYNLHAYEELYFDFGLSAITDFWYTGFALQISPNLKFDALNKKLSFFIGSGFFSTISVYPGIGVTFYLKIQYNFKNKLSIGLVYNHSIIFVERDVNYVLMNPGIYFSLQL